MRTKDIFVETEVQWKLLLTAEQLAESFASRADKHDREGSFPFENFAELKAANFLSLTVPKQYGGEEIDLYTFLLVIERLGSGDASTALGLGWHLGIILNINQSQSWPEEVFRKVCHQVVQNGALINSCATEPETGSPSRGGKPQTIATTDGHSWVLNGRKTWSTLSPALEFFLISASIADSDDVGIFLVPKGVQGLSVEETWDSLGMRATGSHDVVLQNVTIDQGAIVERRASGQAQATSSNGGGWLLHIAACYLGVAYAAREYALRFAKEYQPNSISQPISELPAVRDKLGRMEIKLLTARSMLYTVAKKWDQFPEQRSHLRAELGAAKYVATNLAVEIVDLAMRVMGGRSLLKQYPLERLYRDVRAGLHNPPMDDVTIGLLAKKALEEI